MECLRTPDSAFDRLDDWPYAPHHVAIDDTEGGELRVHHVDEGSGPVVLLMHGEPSWSYLYRSMIPPLVEAGFRVVAPDLVGFGRSDKPAEQDDYTYRRHVDWMAAVLFDELDLGDITFFGQDWGGLVGLRLLATEPDRYRAVVLSNTGLPTGDQTVTPAFEQWREFSRSSPRFEIGRIIQNGTVRTLTDAEVASYDAPFPDDSYKAGARIFPSLVPATPDDPAAADQRAAWESLGRLEIPVLCAWSDADPITVGADRPFKKLIPGARDMPHTTVPGGHFVQEDSGSRLAELVIETAGRR